jgi:hypothetical protein
MKRKYIAFAALAAFMGCVADTTVDPVNHVAYGANTGWINAYADGTNGAIIGDSFCSGYLYGANIGWIHLGDGSPANAIAYQNNSAGDYGVNHDGVGHLTGYAYGANIGWINFEQTYGQPKVDLMTGELTGYAYGANVGWINLNGVTTLSLAVVDADLDGISDAWEYSHTNTLEALSHEPADADGDGVPDIQEYAADTNPFDPNELFEITDLQIIGSTNLVEWTAKPTRLYSLQHTTVLSNGISWIETSSPFIPVSGPVAIEEVSGISDTNRFYRVEATIPLTP